MTETDKKHYEIMLASFRAQIRVFNPITIKIKKKWTKNNEINSSSKAARKHSELFVCFFINVSPRACKAFSV